MHSGVRRQILPSLRDHKTIRGSDTISISWIHRNSLKLFFVEDMQPAKHMLWKIYCDVTTLTPCLKLYPGGCILIYVCGMRLSFLVLGSFLWWPVDASKQSLFKNPFIFLDGIAFCNFFFLLFKKNQKKRSKKKRKRKKGRRNSAGDCSWGAPEDDGCNWSLEVAQPSFPHRLKSTFPLYVFLWGWGN